MTKLEAEIFAEVIKVLPESLRSEEPDTAWRHYWMLYDPSPARALFMKAAAEVAKKYIDGAWWDGCYSFDPDDPDRHQSLYEQWLKENGVI